MMVRIYWRNNITGNTGNGTQHYSVEEAENIIADLNMKYPDIFHWYE